MTTHQIRTLENILVTGGDASDLSQYHCKPDNNRLDKVNCVKLGGLDSPSPSLPSMWTISFTSLGRETIILLDLVLLDEEEQMRYSSVQPPNAQET